MLALKEENPWCVHNDDSTHQGIVPQAGVNVVSLQRAMPNARIVYASATGVSEISNMGFMERLGLWGKGTLVFLSVGLWGKGTLSVSIYNKCV